MKMNPEALATCGELELDSRDGVQEVTAEMIMDHVLAEHSLPPESAYPFSQWLDQEWNFFNEDGENTNGMVIEGALSYWRGQ